MDVVICVGVPGLEGENWCIGRRVQLDNGLHGQGTVYEVWGLVVDVTHVDDDALIVSICTINI